MIEGEVRIPKPLGKTADLLLGGECYLFKVRRSWRRVSANYHP
ncbi:hypothetical protein SPLC1_S060400 [Arthrospira platensis C1]|nr:hypothetical protein SPLC1_S060400 [Arthrospira platensis C1]